MPNEPEREIEKTLKAYAEKRRAEAGAARELHPATRRLLHGEAARVHGQKSRGAGFWTRMFQGGWPQLAVGFGALVLLGVTVSILLKNSAKEKRANANYAMANSPAVMAPPQPKADLKLESRDSSGRIDSFKTEIPAASAPVVEAEKHHAVARQLAENKDNQAKVVMAPVASPPPAKPNLSNGSSHLASQSVAVNKTFALNGNADAPVIASATPAPADAIREAAKEPELAAVAISGATAPAADTRKFARLRSPTAAAKSSKKDASLLASFQVETTGSHIRIIDSDGSIYTGDLMDADRHEPAGVPPGFADGSSAQKTDTLRQRSFVAGSIAPQSAASTATNAVALEVSNFVFRVSGTNITRNKPVVFTGTFLGNVAAGAGKSPPVGAFGGAGAGAGGLVAKKADVPTPLRMLNLRIAGRATIGANSVEISAKAVDKK